MDECLIFQKLTTQEKVIIHALDHLDNTKDDNDEDIEDDGEDEDEDAGED
jgi:hypothetical protein